MIKYNSIKKYLNELLFILPKKQRRIGFLVMLMSLINAFLQTLGVALIIPLVSMMLTRDSFMKNDVVKNIQELFHINSYYGISLFICIGVIVLYVLKDVFGVFFQWISAKFACMVERGLSRAMLNEYMNKPYDFFLNHGTGKGIRDIQGDTIATYSILLNTLNIVAEALIILIMLVFITITDFKMAIFMFAFAAICLFSTFLIFKRGVKKQGVIQREAAAENNKVLLQALEGIKEVQLMKKEEYFVKGYDESLKKVQKPQVLIQVSSTAPSYLIECIFVVGFMIYLFGILSVDTDMSSFIPVLASFSVGAVRLLPSMGRISSSINQIIYRLGSLDNVYQNIKGIESNTQLNIKKSNDQLEFNDFHNEISLNDVSWHYWDSDKMVLDKLDLVVKRGESVGIVGASGTGKSTLADILLGLHIPQAGTVEIDGVNINAIPNRWSQLVGYVPQNVYLVDGTIRENVAFGVAKENINDELIWESLRRAQLDEYIQSLEDGLNTIVGERGVKFSGGQRQRIAIARALYRTPQILVMDEATSALDNDTEKAVMEAIENLYGTVTMVIIAHRLTTVKKCDSIYEITNGKAYIRTKEELFENN